MDQGRDGVLMAEQTEEHEVSEEALSFVVPAPARLGAPSLSLFARFPLVLPVPT